MINICGISDLHGHIEFDVEKCDVLCIAGDILPLNAQSHFHKSEQWLINEFKPWCEKQKANEICLIGGNHDFFLHNFPEKVKGIFKDSKVHYLFDEKFTYSNEIGEEYVFYGSPWCHIFGRWAFMGYTDEKLKDIFLKMPDNVDVLITHDAPYGTSDICMQDLPYISKKHIGNKALKEAIEQKKPKINLHGHLHSTNHDKEMLDDTAVYNVSVLDETYKLTYYPLYLELEKTNGEETNK